MSDPFSVHPRAAAQQVPGQQPFPEVEAVVTETEPQPVPEAPQGSDLAAASEVGIAAAQTAPGSRQRKTEQDKAAAALEVATRRVNSLRERIAKTEGLLAALKADHDAAVRRADYLAGHPALQD